MPSIKQTSNADYQPLEVGTDGAGMVIINHINLPVDKEGIGHMLFTPEQGMIFGRLIIMKSREARRQKPLLALVAKAAA
jgi:ABC-type Co2+ transport system permease subunit